MYLNECSVRIENGQERNGGYVHLRHGQTYSIIIKNGKSVNSDVTVSLDGKEIGSWRVNSYQTIRLERPANEEKLFTFYKSGSVEADQSQLSSVGRDELGLVKVTFRFSQNPSPIYDYAMAAVPVTYTCRTEPFGKDYGKTRLVGSLGLTSSGGTGLSGHSNQKFNNVSPLTYDDAQTMTIFLRLVCSGENEITPLTPVTRSSPYPPPVN